mmetsp:Transcript_10658/g.65738  ORF Transcript_10658/g.65738 Transcript_10658/m.65738 type:complete len:250 (-) Transcript_10658:721-1470(-)
MKVKRAKQVRRHVRFYRVCHGFREPYKVVMDGNFLHACIEAKLGGPRDTIPKLLCGHAKIFSTKCALHELKSMGDPFAGTYLAARRFDCVRCGHENSVSAADCLKSLVEKGNHEHFFVATQDRKLQTELQSIPGVAILRAIPQGVTIEPPSKAQQKNAELASLENKMPSAAEGKLLEASTDKKEGGAKVSKKRKKGPNPMSCLPKKKKQPVLPTTQAGTVQKKRNRPRRRKGMQEKEKEEDASTMNPVA